MKKFGTFLVFSALFLAIFPAIANAKPSPKVDICHLEDKSSGNFHLINVSENALQAHLDHGDAVLGDWVVNSEEVTIHVIYSGDWYYKATFVRNGTDLAGKLTDPYVAGGGLTGPIIDGSINGDQVVFSFDYGTNSVQGVRTYEGTIQANGDLVGIWSQTGSQNEGEDFPFTIEGFAARVTCE